MLGAGQVLQGLHPASPALRPRDEGCQKQILPEVSTVTHFACDLEVRGVSFPSGVPSACLSYSLPLAAIVPAHLVFMETTVLSPASAQRGSATLCLGPASWVSRGRMREYLVLSVVFGSLICGDG